MKIIILILSIICYVSTFSTISLKQCETSKACFKSSKECEVENCNFVVTWKPIRYNGKSYLEIEMLGTVQSSGGYIAMGFSEDKLMGDDGVLACYVTLGNSQVNIVAGFNEPSKKSNRILPSSKLDKDFLVTSDKNLYGGIFYGDRNKLSCKFLRLMTPEKSIAQVKDLSGKNYYIFVATGPEVNSNGLSKHFPGSNVISDISIDFTRGSYNTVVGSSKMNSPLAKAHGVLMVIAFMTCCSVAILLARYYKNVWIMEIKKEGEWFNPHRGLQSCGFILIVISLIMIIVHVNGYSKLEDFPAKLHPIFGFIVVILFLINPFVALCRCNVNHKNRPIFNWIHFIIGIIAHILSVPAIMIGLKLPGAGLKLSQLNYPQWIVFFFVIFQVVIEIILEIHNCLHYRRNKDKRHIYEKEKEEYEEAILKNLYHVERPILPRQKGRKFKLAILGIYITVCIIVTLVISIIIIVN